MCRVISCTTNDPRAKWAAEGGLENIMRRPCKLETRTVDVLPRFLGDLPVLESVEGIRETHYMANEVHGYNNMPNYFQLCLLGRLATESATGCSRCGVL